MLTAAAPEIDARIAIDRSNIIFNVINKLREEVRFVKRSSNGYSNSAPNDLLLEKVDWEGSCMTVAKIFA
jgi:hypothetical protein